MMRAPDDLTHRFLVRQIIWPPGPRTVHGEGDLRAAVVMDAYDLDGLTEAAEEHGVTVDVVGRHHHGPLVRLYGARDQLRRLVADQWTLRLSFADGEPTLSDINEEER